MRKSLQTFSSVALQKTNNRVSAFNQHYIGNQHSSRLFAKTPFTQLVHNKMGDTSTVAVVGKNSMNKNKPAGSSSSGKPMGLNTPNNFVPEHIYYQNQQQQQQARQCCAQQQQQAQNEIDHVTSLSIFDMPFRVRKTGIIATIGPSSRTVPVLKDMMCAGMCIARMNFSHGTHEYHKGTVDVVREATKELSNELGYQLPIAIALDTKGPEIRTGMIAGDDPNAEIEIKTGQQIRVTVDDAQAKNCSNELIYIDYKNMPKVCKVGGKIFIDDGILCLNIDKIDDDNNVTCTVVAGGMLCSKKGCNLPQTSVDLPAVSEQDKKDLKFAVENDLDFIFASFIRDAAGVREIRSLLGQNSKIKIISKIENHQGVDNLDEILQEGDGIMVARGDLGVELPPEKVFSAQKLMCARANRANKPVIVATQMLESMTKKARPTRAEVTDVGTAVLDGADCVMLSGESAKGLYPVKAVLMQHLIACEAENLSFHAQFFDDLRRSLPMPFTTYAALAVAAVEVAKRIRAAAIICLTSTGRSCQAVAQFRPRCPVLAVTRDARVARQLNVVRAMIPVHHTAAKAKENEENDNNAIITAVQVGRTRGFLADKAPVVILSGWHKGDTGCSNTLRIMFVNGNNVENVVPDELKADRSVECSDHRSNNDKQQQRCATCHGKPCKCGEKKYEPWHY